MALSFCSAAVDVALRGSVAHENDIAELDLATLKHASTYFLHALDGTSTDANLIAPHVTDLNTGIICASYAIKSVKFKTYLRVRPGGAGAKVSTQTYVGSREKFTIQDHGSGYYSFRSVKYGTYLRAQKVSPYGTSYLHVDQQTRVGSQEKFKLEFDEKGFVSLVSIYKDTKRYVRAGPGGEDARVDLGYISGSWEKFELVCLV